MCSTLMVPLVVGAALASAGDFDIRSFGAVESDLLQTPAIQAAHPTPSAARWSAEKRLYVTDDPLVEDVWGSALAVLRGETPHAAAIARRLCASYQYYVGWGRTGAVKPNHDGELSPLAAGAFGFAMAQDDPLFARTFFTDFVRSDRKTPAAVSGVRLALKKLLGGSTTR